MNTLSFNIKNTKAILIGISKYDHLHPIPPAENNVDDFEKILLDSKIIGLPAKNIVKKKNLRNDEIHSLVLDFIDDVANLDVETLIFYYTGHGIRSSEELYLTGTNSRPSASKSSALSYNEIRLIIENSQIQNRIIILDSCYSGVATMGDNFSDTEFEIKGSFTLTSAPWDKKAYFKQGARNTQFTAELLALMKLGIPLEKPSVTLENVFTHLRAKLNPVEPQRKNNLTVSEYFFFKNVQFEKLILAKSVEHIPDDPVSANSKVWVFAVSIALVLLFFIAYIVTNRDEKRDPQNAGNTTATAYGNIRFEYDSSVLQTSAYPSLAATAAALKANPSVIIEINGYTSDREPGGSSEKYLKRLSYNYTLAVRNYLIVNGIDSSRIICKGWGSTNPIADNATAEGRNLNRRVQFKTGVKK